MALAQIYRGMQNGAETIQSNFSALEKMVSQGKVIFDGAQYFTNNHSHTYSQDDLTTGIALIFERYNPDGGTRLGYGQTIIYYPKAVLETIYTISQDVPLVNTSKTFTINKTNLVGHAEHEKNNRRNMCLRRIVVM